MDLMKRQDEPTQDNGREGLYIHTHTLGNEAQVDTIRGGNNNQSDR